MSFLLAFSDPVVLAGAASGGVTGRYPHLRLVSLVAGAQTDEIVRSLPPYLRDRVILEPSPELLASGEIQALLTQDRDAAQTLYPQVAPEDIVTWADVPSAYERWLQSCYLPAQRKAVYTPDGLFPVDWRPDPFTMELLGSCGAAFLQQAVREVADDLDASVTCFHTVRNHPAEVNPPAREASADVRVVVPPLRYMHPASLDNFVTHPDHRRFFAETVGHMSAYLDSVLADDPSVDLYVCGFIEPHMNPMGLFFHDRDLSNFKYFVRRLNDEIVDWCGCHAFAHFVDADAIAGAIGKAGVDEGPLSFYSHRAPLDMEYDDNTDHAYPTIPVRASFDIRTGDYLRAVVREIMHRHVIRGQRARVKAVIVDLDNTLWRGIAADGVIGSFNGRPQGLIEALKILRERGVFIGIASKNDEEYVREHWEEIVHEWPEVPLTTELSLDDFDALRINFRPKSTNVAEILEELNVLPEHAVFIDDNPLEREEIQAAFPRMRVLGAELNYVRRELIHSPFTQSDISTAEDRIRGRTARQQAALKRAEATGTAEAFLSSLRLRCQVVELTDPVGPDAARAVQLINKTNQWSLNGERITDAQLRAAMEAGVRLVTGIVHDAHHAYGTVAAALIDSAEKCLTHLVVSCRVIGMGIDDTLMSWMLSEYGSLEVSFRPTDRNRAAAAALHRWTQGQPSGRARLERVTPPAHVTIDASRALAPALGAN